MLLPAALTLCLLVVPLMAYPVFGTKRYGRGASATPGLPWTTRPYAYYGDYYYPQQQPNYEPLAYYYDVPRHHSAPAYGYYTYDDDVVSSDPIDDIEEEIQHEAEREQREEALPIGHEMWFEHGGARDDAADVDSGFLRDLILSQLYSSDRQRQRAAAAAALYPHAQAAPLYMQPQVQPQLSYGLPFLPENEERILADDAAAWEYTSSARQLPYPYGTEDDDTEAPAPSSYDEDVAALKSLVKKKALQEAAAQKRPEFVSELGPWFEGSMRFSDRKALGVDGDSAEAAPESAATTATPAPATEATSTARPAFDDKRRGMKEVAMPRPATPVRRPTDTRSGSHHSVYDTIRHLLNMEEGLQHKEELSRRPPQKRFVSSEEALVDQLGGLHKPLST